jgi:ABC-type transport system involved in cytochrome c biogenesis permease subunit
MMATNVLPIDKPIMPGGFAPAPARRDAALFERIFRPLASLKLTVVLFAMAIFIIWAGTLAQKESGIWIAIAQYFRTWFAFVEFKIFFFFLSRPPDWTSGFFFPGGRLIGVLMAINLLSAHAVRFKMQARDWRLPAGLAVIAAGIGLLCLVVVVGNHLSGVQAGSPVEWSTLWFVFKLGLAAVVAAGIAGLSLLNWSRRFERNLLLVGTLSLAASLAWLLYRNDFVPNPSSLRIVWQLIEGEAVGLTLLAGCLLLFKKRAGIVLIHAGVGLMMFNELFVDITAKEPQQLTVREGQARNFAEDSRTCELAVVDKSAPRTDEVVVIPQSRLRPGGLIHDDSLPFDLRVLQFFENSELVDPAPGDKTIATAGAGLDNIAVAVSPGTGTDSSSKVDVASAYVELLKKGTNDPLETHLVSVNLEKPDRIKFDGKEYEIALRFKRVYKPYVVRLVKTEEVDWPGTTMPRYYSSDIHLVSTNSPEDRHEHIWMNNPLRFGGETFYQSGFNQIGDVKYSTLSVVDNTGWMIPYIGCMIVATGLLAHFLGVLLRFTRRLSPVQQGAPQANREIPVEAVLLSEKSGRAAKPLWLSTAADFFPWVVVAVFAGWALSKAIIPGASPDAMHLYEFGEIPVMHEGRIKPIDTLARTSLWAITDAQTYVDDQGRVRPAIEWLLDVIADPEAANKQQVIHIDNPDVLNMLGLPRRKNLRYSIDELSSHMADLKQQVDKAEATDPQQRSAYQERILDLARRITAYIVLREAFDPTRFPALPSEQEIKENPRSAFDNTLEVSHLWDKPRKNSQEKPKPLIVPMDTLGGEWHSYASAVVLAYVNATALQQPPDEATRSFASMFKAYGKRDVAGFNTELAKYRAQLEAAPPKPLDPATVNFEAFFNHFAPFECAFWLYLFAIVLACLGLLGWLLGWSGPFNKTAFGVIVFTLGLHTFALLARIYISGRPPVTTLYSAAVFIGWAGVLLGIVLELVYRIGIGNLIAGAAGAVALGTAQLIFEVLDTGKDTIVVPEAVLDTQFWLGTHVVCEALGYATTFVAALIGFSYILLGLFTPLLGYRLDLRTKSMESGLSIANHGRGASIGTTTVGKVFANMIYGSVCCAIFFSFVGTVLGGLWADDSWGRFWGWDPKENGSLIIVLWNALVLHALWDGIVKDRGLAVLALGGNIAMIWSYFGVNFLGVGLHSYGFTDAGVWVLPGIIVACHLALMALGSIPKRYWWSNRAAAA